MLRVTQEARYGEQSRNLSSSGVFTPLDSVNVLFCEQLQAYSPAVWSSPVLGEVQRHRRFFAPLTPVALWVSHEWERTETHSQDSCMEGMAPRRAQKSRMVLTSLRRMEGRGHRCVSDCEPPVAQTW